MKKLIYKFKGQKGVHFVEAFNPEDARTAMLEFDDTVGKAGRPSRDDLNRIWDKGNPLKCLFTCEDIYNDNKIKKAEIMHRVKFWLSRVSNQDDTSNKTEYVSKTNDKVVTAFHSQGYLIPNVGFVIPREDMMQEAIDKKLWANASYIDSINSLYEYCEKHKVLDENYAYGIEPITVRDALNYLKCLFGL